MTTIHPFVEPEYHKDFFGSLVPPLSENTKRSIELDEKLILENVRVTASKCDDYVLHLSALCSCCCAQTEPKSVKQTRKIREIIKTHPELVNNFLDDFGTVICPLFMVIANNNLSTVKLLIANGADLNYVKKVTTDENRFSFLYWAFAKRKWDEAKLLIAQGAHREACRTKLFRDGFQKAFPEKYNEFYDDQGNIRDVTDSFYTDISAYKIDRKQELIFDMCLIGDLGDVKKLYSENPESVKPLWDLSTPLHYACRAVDSYRTELIDFLLSVTPEKYLPLGVDTMDILGNTPLHEASLHGNMELCKVLVSKFSANANARNKQKKIAFSSTKTRIRAFYAQNSSFLSIALLRGRVEMNGADFLIKELQDFGRRAIIINTLLTEFAILIERKFDMESLNCIIQAVKILRRGELATKAEAEQLFKYLLEDPVQTFENIKLSKMTEKQQQEYHWKKNGGPIICKIILGFDPVALIRGFERALELKAAMETGDKAAGLALAGGFLAMAIGADPGMAVDSMEQMAMFDSGIQGIKGTQQVTQVMTQVKNAKNLQDIQKIGFGEVKAGAKEYADDVVEGSQVAIGNSVLDVVS